MEKAKEAPHPGALPIRPFMRYLLTNDFNDMETNRWALSERRIVAIRAMPGGHENSIVLEVRFTQPIDNDYLKEEIESAKSWLEEFGRDMARGLLDGLDTAASLNLEQTKTKNSESYYRELLDSEAPFFDYEIELMPQ